jgi:hypothetical protein
VSSETASAAAASVGAADLFVLRRVAPRRFVHFGGVGRGEGWAGIVDANIEDEELLAEALRTDELVRLADDHRRLVFGPYYARGAVVVPVSADTLVVFGQADAAIDATDDALIAAAQAASDAIGPTSQAKQLADDLELLEAVRAAAAVAPLGVEEAMKAIAGVAVDALSCELGIVYVADGDRIKVVERGWKLGVPADDLKDSLTTVIAHHDFPYCVQDARSNPPPGALASDPGIRSYYLLELTGPARGVLLVAHTDAAPRGFTLLCRQLGARLAEVAAGVLGAAVTREWTAAEAARLQTAFARLEA